MDKGKKGTGGSLGMMISVDAKGSDGCCGWGVTYASLPKVLRNVDEHGSSRGTCSRDACFGQSSPHLLQSGVDARGVVGAPCSRKNKCC